VVSRNLGAIPNRNKGKKKNRSGNPDEMARNPPGTKGKTKGQRKFCWGTEANNEGKVTYRGAPEKRDK